MRAVLAQPVEVGAVCLAPTTELAGLAALARAAGHEQRLAILTELARAIRAEDEERDRITRARVQGLLTPLPHRDGTGTGGQLHAPTVLRSRDERTRLIIRVLCELVAYDVDAGAPGPRDETELQDAGRAAGAIRTRRPPAAVAP